MEPSTIIYDINNIREEFDFHDFRLSFEFSMNEFGGTYYSGNRGNRFTFRYYC